MTPAQLLALSRPCRSPDDWGPLYRCLFPFPGPGSPQCGIVCSLILTVDVAGESPGFLPPHIGAAAWHASVTFVRGSLRQAFAYQAEPVPPHEWALRLVEAAAIAQLDALAGVGWLGREYQWTSVSSAHHWRPLRGHELDGFIVGLDGITIVGATL